MNQAAALLVAFVALAAGPRAGASAAVDTAGDSTGAISTTAISAGASSTAANPTAAISTAGNDPGHHGAVAAPVLLRLHLLRQAEGSSSVLVQARLVPIPPPSSHPPSSKGGEHGSDGEAAGPPAPARPAGESGSCVAVLEIGLPAGQRLDEEPRALLEGGALKLTLRVSPGTAADAGPGASPGASSGAGGGTLLYSLDPCPALDVPVQLQIVDGKLDRPVYKVKVQGKRVVDLDDETGSTLIDREFFEDLPVFGHSYQAALTYAPGVNDANGDGNPNVHGGRERDFHMAVDGISNVDPLTGTYMSNVNPDSIEEIELVTTGAPAEYGRGQSFGRIITKQGGNTFEGIAGIFLRSSYLDGNTNQPENGDKLEYHDVHPSISLTGPIIKDKLFFALFHQYRDAGRPVSFVQGGGLVVQTRGSTNLDKVTWQATPRNKIAFQVQADPVRTGPLSVDSYTDPRSGYDGTEGGPTYMLRWNTNLGSRFTMESIVASSHTGKDVIPVTDRVKNACVRDLNATRRLDPYGRPGGQSIDEDYCFQERNATTSGSYFSHHTDDRIRYTVKSDATYLVEGFWGTDHTLKGGILVERERYKRADINRSFLDFGEALRPTGGGIDSPVVTGGGLLVRTVYVPGYPEAEANRADGVVYGLYLEDQFRPAPNVSIRVGVRAERERIEAPGFAPFDPQAEYRRYNERYEACLASNPFPTPALRDRCARSAFRFFHVYEHFPTIGNNPLKQVILDPTTQLQKRTPETFRIGNTNIGPRFSVSWDPWGDGRTKLFGTAGRVYDKTFLAAAAQEQGPDFYVFAYQASSLEQNCHVDPQGRFTCEHVRVVTQTEQQAQISPATIVQIDRDLKTPYMDEYTVGLSREIAAETAFNLTYIRRKFRDQFQDNDLNHYSLDQGRGPRCTPANPATPSVPIDPRPDGRPDDCNGSLKYVLPPGGGPGSFIIVRGPDGIPDSHLYNPFFNQVRRVGNYNSTEYEAWELELVRRLHRNWQMEASYVWSKAVGQAEDYLSLVGNDPTSRQDEYGYLEYDQRHFVKVNVTTQVPLWNVRLGSAFNWASGQPYPILQRAVSEDQPAPFGNFGIGYLVTRTSYPTHTRNDQRNDSYWIFNVNAKKDFTIGKTNIETSLEIFNLFNNRFLVVQNVLNGHTVATTHVGRQIQLGARFSF